MKEPVHISTPMAELLATSDDPVIVAIRQHCPVFNNMLKSSKCTGCKAKDELQVNLEDLLDNQDIMKLMHLSARTLQTLRTNGTIKYIKLRNKIYYRRQDIEQVLKDNYIMFKIRERYGKE